MKQVLAIDPGMAESAYIELAGDSIVDLGIVTPDQLLRRARNWAEYLSPGAIVAIEKIECMGMAVGATTFDTAMLIGRLIEIFCKNPTFEIRLVGRRDVKLWHCQSVRAKDSNIRQVLIDKYGEPGTKKSPGFTYGLKSHMWSAFAIATYITEMESVKLGKD